MGSIKNGLAALLSVMLAILPSFAYAQDCGDLEFTASNDPVCGANFSVSLDQNILQSPYWGSFSNATLGLPSGISNVLRPIFVNLSAEGGSVEWLLSCSTPGNYTLNVSVPNGTEICVKNLSVQARAPTSPNISVSAPSPITLIALNSNAFNVTLSNLGNGSAVNVNTTFSVPNAAVSPSSISRSTLANGSSAVQAFSITPTMCGISSNTVYVNYFDEVGSPHPSSFTSNMTVTGPYITVSNPSFSVSSPQEQSTITISATVNNSIQNNCNYNISNNFTVSFYNGNPSSGGTLLKSNTLVPLLAGGNAETTTASWTVPSAGTFTIYAVVSLAEQGFNSSYTSSAPITGTSRPAQADTSIFGTSGGGMTSQEPQIESPPAVEAACKEAWSCTEWGECSIDTMSEARTCTDANQCNTIAGKPIESQSCTPQIVRDAANAIAQASGATTDYAKSLLEQAKAAYDAKDYALAADLARRAIEADVSPAGTTTTTPTGFATFATARNAATVAAVLAILAAAYYLWARYGGKKIKYSFRRK